MQRCRQILFIFSLLGISWLSMMALHESGHCVGAAITGGHVERVVVHPLKLSRTDVSPNPHPAIVVWAGPVFGCVAPLTLILLVPEKLSEMRLAARFLAGFCLVANGAYIAVGAATNIGDAREMLRTGSPIVCLVTFGASAAVSGLLIWHRLGSLRNFLATPSAVNSRSTYIVVTLLVLFLSVAIVRGGD